MKIKRHLTALATSLLVTSAWAQTTGKPLNLKLPPSDVPAASASSGKPAGNAPGVYYGDTSGRMGDTDAEQTSTCDDSTYNKPQVHGAVSTGVVSGSHIGTGTWTGGEVNVSKAFGSCDDPGGGVSMSISVNQGHFNGRGRGH